MAKHDDEPMGSAGVPDFKPTHLFNWNMLDMAIPSTPETGDSLLNSEAMEAQNPDLYANLALSSGPGALSAESFSTQCNTAKAGTDPGPSSAPR